MNQRPPLTVFSALVGVALMLTAGVSCRDEAGSDPGSASLSPDVEVTAREGTTYVMEMKGMVCGGCMMEVKDALAKLDAVPADAVQFKRGSRPETKKVVFTAESATLTKEQVTEALGEAAERLVIEGFTVEGNS